MSDRPPIEYVATFGEQTTGYPTVVTVTIYRVNETNGVYEGDARIKMRNRLSSTYTRNVARAFTTGNVIVLRYPGGGDPIYARLTSVVIYTDAAHTKSFLTGRLARVKWMLIGPADEQSVAEALLVKAATNQEILGIAEREAAKAYHDERRAQMAAKRASSKRKL